VAGVAGAVLPRDFFARRSLQVAPELLGCVLEHDADAGLVAVRITEVEAYEGAHDPASHSYRGRTARNAVMFGPPGHAYVYFTYGMHWCVNLVCLTPGTASAVLIRAGQVISGVALATERRSAGRARPSSIAERELARGPARLCQALGIDRAQNGLDAVDPSSPLRIRAGAEAGGGPVQTSPGQISTVQTNPSQISPVQISPVQISRGPRVGISVATERPWRFWVTGDPTVSVYRPHVPRVRPGRSSRSSRPGEPAAPGQPAAPGEPAAPGQPAQPGHPAQPKAVSPSACEDGTINR
jgi:DNA-3-methyladenine glycosylase